jgi:amphiphysin
MMNDLSSRLGGMTTSSAPQAAASPQPHGRIPSKAEATSAFKSAGTVSSLYGKYGASSSTGAKTSQPTPSWQDVKAGAAAAKDLHGFAGKYAPKTTPEQREKALGFGNRVLASQGHATVPAGAMQAMSKASSTPAQSTGVLSSAAPPIPAGKPTLPVRAPAAKPTCTALFSFEAQQPDDLPFQKGDVIEVLDRTDDPEAWWRGSCRGRTGLFPANYCRMNS